MTPRDHCTLLACARCGWSERFRSINFSQGRLNDVDMLFEASGRLRATTLKPVKGSGKQNWSQTRYHHWLPGDWSLWSKRFRSVGLGHRRLRDVQGFVKTSGKPNWPPIDHYGWPRWDLRLWSKCFRSAELGLQAIYSTGRPSKGLACNGEGPFKMFSRYRRAAVSNTTQPSSA